MKRIALFLLLMASFSFAACSANISTATSFPYSNSTPNIYLCLNESVSGSGNMITITGANVTLDGQGFSVTSTGGDPIHFDAGSNGGTIKNITGIATCAGAGCGQAVTLKANGINVTNSTFDSQNGNPVYLETASNNNFTDVVVFSRSREGASIYLSNYNTFSDFTVIASNTTQTDGSNLGINLMGDNNNITNCTATSQTSRAIQIYTLGTPTGNIISNCVFETSDTGGVAVNSRYAGNTFQANNITAAVWVNDTGSTANTYSNTALYYANGSGIWAFGNGLLLTTATPPAYSTSGYCVNHTNFAAPWLGSGSDCAAYTYNGLGNTPPTSTIQYPSNGAGFTNQTWMNFSLLGTDNEGALLNATLWLNGTADYTNTSMVNNSAWTLNATLGYGIWNAVLQVCDQNTTPICTNSSTAIFTLSQYVPPPNYTCGTNLTASQLPIVLSTAHQIYCLTQDKTGTGTLVTIAATDIKLYMQGHLLNSTNDQTVVINTGGSYCVIDGGRIDSWGNQAAAINDKGSDCNFTNLVVVSEGGNAFYSESVSNISIDTMTAIDHSREAVAPYKSSYMIIRNLYVYADDVTSDFATSGRFNDALDIVASNHVNASNCTIISERAYPLHLLTQPSSAGVENDYNTVTNCTIVQKTTTTGGGYVSSAVYYENIAGGGATQHGNVIYGNTIQGDIWVNHSIADIDNYYNLSGIGNRYKDAGGNDIYVNQSWTGTPYATGGSPLPVNSANFPLTWTGAAGTGDWHPYNLVVILANATNLTFENIVNNSYYLAPRTIILDFNAPDFKNCTISINGTVFPMTQTSATQCEYTISSVGNYTIFGNVSNNENETNISASYDFMLFNYAGYAIFSNPEDEGIADNIELNVSFENYYGSASASFIYNGQTKSVSRTDRDLGVLFNSSVIPPAFSSVGFIWTLNLETIEALSMNYSNTTNVNIVVVSYCEEGQIPILNFSFFDQSDAITSVSSTMAATFLFKSPDGSYQKNVSLNFSTPTTNVEVCLNASNGTYYVDSIQTYGADGYRTLFYYLQNQSVQNPITYNISLYDLDTASSVLTQYQIYKGSNLPLQDAYIQIQRYYPATNQIITVSMAKTDSNGDAETYAIANDVIYRYLISKDYALVYTSNLAPTPCDPAATRCIKQILINPTIVNEYVGFIGNSNVGCYFDNSSMNVYCSSNNPSGTGTQLELRVWQLGTFTNTLVCDNILASGSGTVICSVPDLTHQYYYIGTTTVGSILMIGENYIGVKANAYFDRTTGVVATMGLIGVMGALGMVGGFGAAIIMALLGLIISALIGFIDIAFGAIAAIVAVGLMIAWVLRG